jgi:hypothetical protein
LSIFEKLKYFANSRFRILRNIVDFYVLTEIYSGKQLKEVLLYSEKQLKEPHLYSEKQLKEVLLYSEKQLKEPHLYSEKQLKEAHSQLNSWYKTLSK